MKHALANQPAVLAGLQKLTIPVVAINSDQPPTDFESLARYGVRAVVLPGVKHFPMMEAPDAFNRLLGQTIDELAAHPS